MRHLILLITVVTLAACSKSHSRGSSEIVIPPDLVLNEKGLPPANDQDVATAKALAKQAGLAVGPQSQLLIPADESTQHRQKREADLAKMPVAVQQMVARHKTLCVNGAKKTETPFASNPPKVGEVSTTTQSDQTSGAGCPVDMRTNSVMRATLSAFSQTPVNFAVQFSGDGSTSGAYNDVPDQQITGITSFGLTYKSSGRLNQDATTKQSYTRMDGDGQMAFVASGNVGMTIVAENLEKNDSSKSLRTITVTQGAAKFIFTQFDEKALNQPRKQRFFIGNRELSLAEATELGEFPFEVGEESSGFVGM